MSGSPPKPPSGTTSLTPTSGPPAPMQRKKAPVSIFTQKKRPLKKPPPAPRPASSGQLQNGVPHRPDHQPPQPVLNGVKVAAPAQPAEPGFQEFPIYVSKDALMQGLHHHAMRLQSRPGHDGAQLMMNPYYEDHFTRPLHLHRRNARDKIEMAEHSDAASGVDDKEREMMSMKRAERQAEREANQALIAPTGGEAKKPQKKKPQKKVEDVYYDENDPKQRQRAQLRYEEARPWHLEDFSDNKNIWVGSYEEPLSDSSVLFEVGGDGFRMVPVEKWYKFTQTNRVSVMDSDAVEKHMGKKFKAPRWFLGTQEANDETRRQAMIRQREQRRVEMRGGEDEDGGLIKREEYQADVDEIDFEFNDEFQDDDEGLIFGDQQDDDAKEIEKKIREEMRGANLAGTGVKDEDKDWDAEEQKEKEAEQEEKRRTKRLRKQLIKKERKNEYDSDSDRGEFSESSESEDSDEERERERLAEEEKKKQEEEAAKKLNGGGGGGGGGDKSGTSTKGANTPTERSEKKEQSKLGASLKRPGSPDLSEMSGNESSRKKAKVAHAGRALSPNAPNGARSLSPDAAKPNKTHRTASASGAGSGSGSDTDTSRAGGRLKIRLKNSPPGSRPGSRAQSPQRGVPTAAKPLPFPTLEEVRLAIPEGGIVIGDLVKVFKLRVLQRQVEFIALVKQAGTQDKSSKKILPKKMDGEDGGEGGEGEKGEESKGV